MHELLCMASPVVVTSHLIKDLRNTGPSVTRGLAFVRAHFPPKDAPPSNFYYSCLYKHFHDIPAVKVIGASDLNSLAIFTVLHPFQQFPCAS